RRPGRRRRRGRLRNGGPGRLRGGPRRPRRDPGAAARAAARGRGGRGRPGARDGPRGPPPALPRRHPQAPGRSRRTARPPPAPAESPGRLPVLRRAGVVDAGGRGLVTVLAALVQTFPGETPRIPAGPAGQQGGRAPRPLTEPDLAGGTPGECADAAADPGHGATAGPAFEVIYLLEADDEAVARLRRRLDGLGDSLVVVGGDGLWNVHVHVDDAGAAVEAGVEAGRPYRI